MLKSKSSAAFAADDARVRKFATLETRWNRAPDKIWASIAPSTWMWAAAQSTSSLGPVQRIWMLHLPALNCKRSPRRHRSLLISQPIEAYMAKLFWLEAVLPLAIIGGLICVMGNAPYYIHKVAHGRPKHIGNDVWDVAMERRDKKIMEQYPNAGN